jgi:hypothetical protein
MQKSTNEDHGASDITILRLRLEAAGYDPIPCEYKEVHIKGWTGKIGVTDDEIRLWEKLYPRATNTGLMTQGTSAIDLDIRIPDAGEAAEKLVRDYYEERGVIIVRFGNAPKRAILFRTDEPFDKIECTLTAPNAKAGDKPEKIELLANGQQIVAFGIHPDTHKPYSWHGGSPLNIKREELPYIREADAVGLVNAVVAMLIQDFGYTLTAKSRGSGKTKSKANGKTNGQHSRDFRWSAGLGEKKLEEYCEIVRSATEGCHDEACRKVFMFGRWCGGGLHDINTAREKLKEAARKCEAPSKSNYEEEVERAFLNGVKQPAGPYIEKDKKLDDFWAYLPDHKYIYVPTRELWLGASVDSILPSIDDKTKATWWLKQNQAVEQMTWDPGEEMVVHDRLVDDTGWFSKPGATCFNRYRPPTIVPGDASKAGLWVDHVHFLFNDEDAEHIFKWCAHRRQKPGEKINHALVLGSEEQGIGKDALFVPVGEAVGLWNCDCINPQKFIRQFNAYLRKVLLLISEAKDLGEVNRYQFYDHIKSYVTTPPNMIKIDEKHIREHNVKNCVGIAITTNYKTNGMFLPPEDRRHYIAWSDRTPADFAPGYWNKLFGWYETEGNRHVTAFLDAYDLSKFDPKAEPPKTRAFWEIVDANRAAQDAELADIIDRIGSPPAVTIADITINAPMGAAGDKVRDWFEDPKNQRIVPVKMGSCDYSPLRKPGRKDGYWLVGTDPLKKTRKVIYTRKNASLRDQIEAAEKRAEGPVAVGVNTGETWEKAWDRCTRKSQ